MKQEKKEAFLTLLAEVPNVSAAARVLGLSRTTLYRERQSDPEFAAAWDASFIDGLDVLVAEVIRRGFQGTEKPVYYKGEVVGTVREYSDVLAMFTLKRYLPEFRDTTNVNLEGSLALAPYADADAILGAFQPCA